MPAKLRWFAASLCCCACAGEGRGASAPADAASGDSPPTYHQDIAPLLARHCVPCHSPGQIAPFTLVGYKSASTWAAPMARAVRARTMPPYAVDNSGACNTFRDAAWLEDEEISAIEAWAAAGAPEGTPEAAPEPAQLPALSGEVHSIDTGVEYVPRQDVTDDYRCFLSEAPIAEGVYFVTGFDVRPGDARVVHHVIVYHPQNEAEAAAARALDAAEDGPGYTCYGAAGVKAPAVAAWAPGGGATRFPDGLGVQLAGGRPLIIQMHYNSRAGLFPDRTQVELELRTGGVKAGRFVPLADIDLVLAAGDSDASAGKSLRLMDYTALRTPVQIYGVFPHMHTLGESLRIDVLRDDGSEACVVDVPRWDFHWQRLYFHDRPIPLDPGETLRIACRYDASSRSEVTRWGEGTEDEMCVAGLFVSL